MKRIDSHFQYNPEKDTYSLNEQIHQIQAHLMKAGKMLSLKNRPRVFAAVHHVNWEKQGLVDGWYEIADTVHYDWGNSFDQYASDWHQNGKPAFNKELVRRVALAHRGKPIDIFFFLPFRKMGLPGNNTSD